MMRFRWISEHCIACLRKIIEWRSETIAVLLKCLVIANVAKNGHRHLHRTAICYICCEIAVKSWRGFILSKIFVHVHRWRYTEKGLFVGNFLKNHISSLIFSFSVFKILKYICFYVMVPCKFILSLGCTC